MQSQETLCGYLNWYIYIDLSLQMQYEPFVHSFFPFSHCCYQLHGSWIGNNLPWCRWHLAMSSINEKQLGFFFKCVYVDLCFLLPCVQLLKFWLELSRSRWTDIHYQEKRKLERWNRHVWHNASLSILEKVLQQCPVATYSVVGLLNTITSAAKSSVVNVAHNYSE